MMPRMSEEKQAIYINQLSFNLYKVKHSKDIREVITIDEATKYTYEMAEDTIKKLERQIIYAENIRNTRLLQRMDADLKEFFKVAYNENYKTITNIKVDLNTPKAWITTDEGEEIEIEGKLKADDSYDNYGTLYNLVKTSIDNKKRINIFRYENYTMVFNEPAESLKEKNRKLVYFINRVMDLMGNKLPVLRVNDGKLDSETFKRILLVLQFKDIEFYEEINEFLKVRNNVDDLIKTLIFAKMQTQGYTIANDKTVYM